MRPLIPACWVLISEGSAGSLFGAQKNSGLFEELSLIISVFEAKIEPVVV